jgi:glycosyltransferase involved in cell wall biosynthesis
MKENTLRPRVVILHQGIGDAFRYRCLHLAEQLALLGAGCRIQPFLPGDGLKIRACDLIVVHRVPLDGLLARRLRTLQGGGALVLFDTDDLVFDVEEAISFSRSISDPWLRRALYREDLEGLSRTLRLADGALVATETLAARARQLGKPAWVHRNAFSSAMLKVAEDAFARRRPRSGAVVIGYASGTPTHERDFAIVKPVLTRILESHPAVELRLIGHIDGGDFGSVASRVSRRPFVDWRKLPAELTDLDINLAPVEPGRAFCEAKSEIKYVEAALVRVPTIASATAAFAFAIRDGSNGMLARSADDWLAGLERLVRGRDVREAIGQNAYGDALARYRLEVRAQELKGTLREFLSAHGRAGLAEQLVLDKTVSAPDGAAPEEPVREPAITDQQPRSHLYKAFYSLRYDRPGLFALRVLSFLSAHLRRSGAAGAG